MSYCKRIFVLCNMERKKFCVKKDIVASKNILVQNLHNYIIIWYKRRTKVN